MEVVRKGLWKVVNEDGGTGGRARMKDVVVAGKTGTAQATDRGHEENVAWFTCFAPYDHPKYVIAVMVQGASGHGGEVAGPIAVRILERIIAQEQGNSTCRSPGWSRRTIPIHLTWLNPSATPAAMSGAKMKKGPTKAKAAPPRWRRLALRRTWSRRRIGRDRLASSGGRRKRCQWRQRRRPKNRDSLNGSSARIAKASPTTAA